MKSILTSELEINGLQALQMTAISDHSQANAFGKYCEMKELNYRVKMKALLN